MRVFQCAAFLSPAMLLSGLWVRNLLQGEGVWMQMAGLWVVFALWRIYEMLVLRNWAHWASERWRTKYTDIKRRIVHRESQGKSNPSPSLSWRVRWFLPVLDGAAIGIAIQLGSIGLVAGVALRMAFALRNLRRWRRDIQANAVRPADRVRSAPVSIPRTSRQQVGRQYSGQRRHHSSDRP